MINAPNKAKKLADVNVILREWEIYFNEYHQGGGTDYKSDECKSVFLRQMLPSNSDDTPVYHEFLDGHPGTEAETYLKLKTRIEFRIVQEQNRRQANTGVHVT